MCALLQFLIGSGADDWSCSGAAIHIEESVPRSPFGFDADKTYFLPKVVSLKQKSAKPYGRSQRRAACPSSPQSAGLTADSSAAHRRLFRDRLFKARVLVNSAEKFTPDPASEKKTTGVKKTVRLYTPQERQKPQHPTSTGLRGHESFDPQTAASPSFHTQTGRKDDFAELSELTNILSEETLEQTELSDTDEMLEQLVREGVLSPTALGLETSSKDTRAGNAQTKMSENHSLHEKRELRIWMRKKQRERLAVYQKHRQTLRGWNTDLFPLQVQLYMNESINAVHLLFRYSRSFTARSSSALPFDSTYRVNTSSLRNRLPSENPRPRSAGIKDAPSEEYHKRLGIDRPVTSLPRDRLSQVTRRGMLTSPRSPKSNPGDDRMQSRSLSGASAVKRDNSNSKLTSLHEASKMYTLSHLAVPGLDNSEEAHLSGAGETEWDWLDRLSETGSSISKIDWAAIERMVAEET
ncbi:hypothetical protein WMY93_019499 [Mugilogobius chulae]|uniref:PEHE domain-containing protein n=1 Tax=Mugilogobius chulae TaxID=88201 RepID=A0AAW0NRB2_9GOBI